MEKLRMTWEVTKWEFLRWFKIKDQLLSLFIAVFVSIIVWGGIKLFKGNPNEKIKVGVINSEFLNKKILNKKFILEPVSGLSREEIDNLLMNEVQDAFAIFEKNSVNLLISKEKIWTNELIAAINQDYTYKKINKLSITVQEREEIINGLNFNLIMTKTENENNKGDLIAAGIFLGLMIFGIFFSLAYQFTVITGEKQLRVTEQIISAISPQMWIDGKILGISLFSLVSMFVFIVSSIVFFLLSNLFGDGISIPVKFSNPILILQLMLLSLLGFLFWNTFFGGIAATINDPNTSAKSSFIFFPILPMGLAFLALSDANTFLMIILSVIPITSPSVMSARLVLGNVTFLEFITSILFLLLSINIMRKIAGKIFAAGILLYGKEPKFSEIIKWGFKDKQ